MNRSIRYKVVGTILALSFVTCALIAVSAYFSARKTLKEELFARFESMRATKQFDVTYYIDHLRKHAEMLTQNPWYATEVHKLVVAFEKLQATKLTDEQRRVLEEHYRTDVLPQLSSVTGESPKMEAIFPASDKAQFLQFRYLTTDEKIAESTDRQTDAFGTVYRNLTSKLESLAKTLEFLDIRIVDPRTGETMFSLAPEIDLGVSLFDGYLAKTRLAQVVREVAANPVPTAVRLVDFERYLPFRYQPAAFLVCPTFDEKELAGIVVFRISGERLSEIVNDDRTFGSRPLGQTGEVFLVGDDKLNRTESRFFLQHRTQFLDQLKSSGIAPEVIRDIERYGTTVLTVPRTGTPVLTLFEKGEKTWEAVSYLGVNVIASNAPLDIDDVRWGIVALIHEDEAFHPVKSMRTRLLALTSGIFLIAAAFGARLGGSLVQPIEGLTMAARSLASGFRDVRVNVATGDELDTLGKTFNEMAEVVEQERIGLRKTSFENECLLETIMPPDIVAKLWGGPHLAEGAGYHGEVTVSYSKIHGLKPLYQKNEPEVAIELMDELSRQLEDSATRNGVRPLAFGGGSCFAIAGLDDQLDPGTEEMVRFADDLREILQRFNAQHNTSLCVTTGIHTGPISSGSIGHHEFFRSLWRPTMKVVDLKNDSSGEYEYRIVVTQDAFDAIEGQMNDLLIGNSFEISKDQTCRVVWLRHND